MSRRKKVRTTISFLRRPKKCLRRASHFLEFFRFFRGNMIRLRLIPAHLRCQKDAGFLAARKCMCGFVSLQLFSSHLNQSEPHSNHVNRRKTRTHGAKLPLLIHHQKDLPSALQNQVAFGPPPWQGGTAFAVSKAKDRNVSPEPNVDTNSVQGFLSVGGIVCSW